MNSVDENSRQKLQTTAEGNGPRPHVCPKCNLSFKRLAHLRRHSTTHTGHDNYYCPCSQTFARSDVFARHVRSCTSAELQASQNNTALPQVSKPTRSKKACDRCAQAKLGCDAQAPCARCHRKSVPCVYSRAGYRDPYDEFRWYRVRSFDAVTNNPLQHPTSTREGHAVVDVTDSDTLLDMNGQTVAAVSHSDSAVADATLYTETTQPVPNVSEMDDSNISSGLSLEEFNAPQLGYQYHYSIDNSTFQWDERVDSVFFNAFSHFEPQLPVLEIDMVPEAPPRDTQRLTPGLNAHKLPRPGGFSLLQMDPAEAKCAEIRKFVQGAYVFRNDQALLQYITRDKMLACHQLYGQHIQPNLPLLHSPTYQFTETAPILSLVIMVAGACYSPELLPSNAISRFAMRLSMMINAEHHELYPDKPSLSTVQASVILTAYLTSSRNPTIAQQVPIQFAQTFSLAEQAEILDLQEYQFSAANFNWEEWIQHESQIRLACQILCQEMAGCIFLGRPSSMLPWAFHVPLPSYEKSWNAGTADECRDSIARLPKPELVSTAIKEICNNRATLTPTIETSAYGMFTLILALFSLAVRKAQATFEPLDETNSLLFSSSPPASSDREHLLRYLDILNKDCSGVTVATLAEKAINNYGSTSLKRINEALDRWRSMWEQRKFRDSAVEGCSFSSDPLPFWFLAKLYLLACLIRPDSDSEFSLLMTHTRMSMAEKIRVQEKIVSWLNGFRALQENVPPVTGTGSIASDESASFEEETRLRHLMRPLQ